MGMENIDSAPLYGTTEDGYSYSTFSEYTDLVSPASLQLTDQFGNVKQSKAARDLGEMNKGMAAENKRRLKNMQGKKSPLLATGDQSKVRNVLTTGPVGQAVETGLGAGQATAKTLLGL